MRVPLFRHQARAPLPALFQALGDLDCFGDLTVWGPTATGGRWVAVSVNQCDGDAPMIMTAVVSHASRSPQLRADVTRCRTTDHALAIEAAEAGAAVVRSQYGSR